MSNNKTPVMLLQEYCTQRKIQPPYYEDLPEEVAEANKRIFGARVSAAQKSAIGQGLNKKSAKHAAAAACLLQLGIKAEYQSDMVAADEKQSPISTLLDLCIQRKLPIAEFNEVQACGPSHCPEFTFECRVASLTREAKAPSKSKAKAKAASLMLQVIQEMQMSNPDGLKVMEIKDAMMVEEEIEEDVVHTYREYKKLGVKAPPGVRLCDRHNFWLSFDKEKRDAAAKWLLDTNETEAERVNLAMCALKVKFQIKEVPSYEEKLMSFELEHKDYDCLIVRSEKTFWPSLIEYFLIMLNVPYFPEILQSKNLPNILQKV